MGSVTVEDGGSELDVTGTARSVTVDGGGAAQVTDSGPTLRVDGTPATVTIAADTHTVELEQGRTVEIHHPGLTGAGVPAGGLLGQVLAKLADGDYLTGWVTLTAALVGVDSTTLAGVGTNAQAVFEELDNSIVATDALVNSLEVWGVDNPAIPHLADSDLYMPNWLLDPGRYIYGVGPAGLGIYGDPYDGGVFVGDERSGVDIRRDVGTYGGLYDNALVKIVNEHVGGGFSSTALWAVSNSVANPGSFTDFGVIFEFPGLTNSGGLGIFAPEDLLLFTGPIMGFAGKTSGQEFFLLYRDLAVFGAVGLPYPKVNRWYCGGVVSGLEAHTVTTGTCAKGVGVTPTLTGTGTAWLTEFVAGDLFIVRNGTDTIDAFVKRVLTVTSNTSITMETNYTNAAFSGRVINKVAQGSVYRPTTNKREVVDAIHVLNTSSLRWVQDWWDWGSKLRLKDNATDPTGSTDYHRTSVIAHKPLTTAVTVANTVTETTLHTVTNNGRRRWLQGNDTVDLRAVGRLTKNAAGDTDFVLCPSAASIPTTIRVTFLDAAIANSATPYRWVAEGQIVANASGILQKGWLEVRIYDDTTKALVTSRFDDELAWAEDMTFTNHAVVSSYLFRGKFSAASASLSLSCEEANFTEVT